MTHSDRYATTASFVCCLLYRTQASRNEGVQPHLSLGLDCVELLLVSFALLQWSEASPHPNVSNKGEFPYNSVLGKFTR